ncbi:MAG TPA: winged helix-turn-helix domain-containing protein [Nitrososphaeraceae archaeon]|nr:winged helix-turn-helix domain-containing protein [Nitrososphaeraceae archaeon]
MSLVSREDIIVQLLELSKSRTTKAKMKSSLSVSHSQLRKILAELVDKSFLQFIESQQQYITTHKGLKFLNREYKNNLPNNDIKK